jgi:hypothetical protein
MFTDSTICMGCHLHLADRRGLCDWCYRRTRREVYEGKTTWAELEQHGRVLPAKEGEKDTEEREEPGLGAELLAWFVVLGMGVLFAGAGLLIWARSPHPHCLVGVLSFSLGVAAMLFVMAVAVVRSRSRKPG